MDANIAIFSYIYNYSLGNHSRGVPLHVGLRPGEGSADKDRGKSSLCIFLRKILRKKEKEIVNQ